MAQVQSQPTLVEQVVNAIVSEIVDGDLPANSRLIQDELARAYGVSRQPVQQALLLLRDRGMVRGLLGVDLLSRRSMSTSSETCTKCGRCWMALPRGLRRNEVRSVQGLKDQIILRRDARRSRAALCMSRSKWTCASIASSTTCPAIR